MPGLRRIRGIVRVGGGVEFFDILSCAVQVGGEIALIGGDGWGFGVSARNLH